MKLEIVTTERIDVQATLLKNVAVGATVPIKTKEIKASSIRSAIRHLNKKGYCLKATEEGLVDTVQVSRTK